MSLKRIYLIPLELFILFDKFRWSIGLLLCGMFPLFVYRFLFAYTPL